MIQQTFSKLPANVFKIHMLMLGVCWTFAGSCKHPINLIAHCVNDLIHIWIQRVPKTAIFVPKIIKIGGLNSTKF